MGWKLAAWLLGAVLLTSSARSLAVDVDDINADGFIQILFVGDSNTPPNSAEIRGWVHQFEDLQEAAGLNNWDVVVSSWFAATATPCCLWYNARGLLDSGLPRSAPDVIIFAFGTNDILKDLEADDVVAALQDVKSYAESAVPGVFVLIGLTPPFPESPDDGNPNPNFAELNQRVQQLNDLIRATFLADNVLDLHSSMDIHAGGHYRDALHMNNQGHYARAVVLRDKIVPSGPLVDRYQCYGGSDLNRPAFWRRTVNTSGQFDVAPVQAGRLEFVCNPVDVNGAGIIDPSAFLTCYRVNARQLQPAPNVELRTQFQTTRFAMKIARLICLPSAQTVLP